VRLLFVFELCLSLQLHHDCERIALLHASLFVLNQKIKRSWSSGSKSPVLRRRFLDLRSRVDRTADHAPRCCFGSMIISICRSHPNCFLEAEYGLIMRFVFCGLFAKIYEDRRRLISVICANCISPLNERIPACRECLHLTFSEAHSITIHTLGIWFTCLGFTSITSSVYELHMSHTTDSTNSWL
jgi:hypothetical protein